MVLDYVALAILILVVLVLFYGIIIIHDIPYEIAVKRNHPHQDVLHVVAAVFAIAREQLIPEMFGQIVRALADRHPGKLDTFKGETLPTVELFKSKNKCVEIDTGQSRQAVYDLVVSNLAEYTDIELAAKPLTERSEILLGLRPYPRK